MECHKGFERCSPMCYSTYSNACVPYLKLTAFAPETNSSPMIQLRCGTRDDVGATDHDHASTGEKPGSMGETS